MMWREVTEPSDFIIKLCIQELSCRVLFFIGFFYEILFKLCDKTGILSTQKRNNQNNVINVLLVKFLSYITNVKCTFISFLKIGS